MDNSTEEFNCIQCNQKFVLSELESHISSEHLDYYPYGCGVCNHWLPSEELVQFHALKKGHLPLRIRENPNLRKEKQLKDLIELCKNGAHGNAGDYLSPQESHSPAGSLSSASSNVHGHEASNKKYSNHQYSDPNDNYNIKTVGRHASAYEEDDPGEGSSSMGPPKMMNSRAFMGPDPNADHQSKIKEEPPFYDDDMALKEGTPNSDVPPLVELFTAEQATTALVSEISRLSDQRQQSRKRKHHLISGGRAGEQRESPKSDDSSVRRSKRERKSGSMHLRTDGLNGDSDMDGYSDKDTKDKDSLKQYRNRVYYKRQAIFDCLECGRMFDRRWNRDQHMKCVHKLPPATHDPEKGTLGPPVIPCTQEQITERGEPRKRKHQSQEHGQGAVTSSPKPVMVFPDNELERMCNICKTNVQICQAPGHVRKHILTRPLSACKYCHYQGKGAASVRTHITWKHSDKSVSNGVRDISQQYASHTDMYDKCFGDTPRQPTYTDPATICSATELLRPYAHRASKSVNPGGPKHQPVVDNRNATNHNTINVVSSSSGQITSRKLTTQLKGMRGLRQPLVSHGKKSISEKILVRVELRNGRKYRVFQCQMCKAEILDSLASAHVFQNHIKSPTVQCGYCNFSTSYAKAEVIQHCRARHRGLPVKFIDRKKELEEIYIQYRAQCFPGVGTGGRWKVRGLYGSSPYKEVYESPGNTPSQGKTCSRQQQSAIAVTDSDDDTPTPVRRPEPRRKSGVERTSDAPRERRRTSEYPKWACKTCDIKIHPMWSQRHVWRHMFEDNQLWKYKCSLDGCNYTHYLKRSLESHFRNTHNMLNSLGNANTPLYVNREEELNPVFQQNWKLCFGTNDFTKYQNEFPGKAGKNEDLWESPPTKAPPRKGEPTMVIQSLKEEEQPVPTNDHHAWLAAIGLQPRTQSNFRHILPAPPRQIPVQAAEDTKPSCSVTRDISDHLSMLVAPLVDEDPLPTPVISSYALDAWCNICCMSVLSNEVDDHIWYAHLGGLLPFRCGFCHKNFHKKEDIQLHIHSVHARQLHAQQKLSADFETIVEVPDSFAKFRRTKAQCFPTIQD